MSSYIALWMGPVLIAFVFYSAIKITRRSEKKQSKTA